MSDLNAKVIADLRAELEAARAEIEQQRTRAEAAERELRELTTYVTNLCDASVAANQAARILAAEKRAEASESELGELESELRSLRIAVVHCHASATHAENVRRLNPAVGAILHDAGKLAAIRAHLKGVDWMDCCFFAGIRKPMVYPKLDDIKLLIAAAREALEP